MAACLTALLLICAAFGRPAPASSAYMGKDLRNLHTFDHEVAGHVYALDATTLLVTGFKYDGSAPDAYFWVGSTTSPSSNGIIVPDEAGRSQPLGRYDGSKDLILKLPANLKLGEIKWLSVWCKKFAVDFGNVVFGTIAGPAPRDIGAMKPGDHGTQASAITLLNEKTLHLTNLMYDGTSADAFFVVRKSDGTDMKVRDENNSLTKLHAYTGQNVTLTLPESVSFFDVDYFKIGCVACSEAHGMVAIPASVKVPGTLPSSMANNAAPMKNCETLLDGIFNVEWKINGNVIRFTLTGQAEPGTYLSFGLSGSMTATSMISSDAIVAWIDKTTAQPRAMDYNLGAYSQCANMRGVCPDPELGGANDVMDIVGSFKDGATTISFSRRLNTDNELDKAYLTSGTMQYVVWAIGPINADGIASKHSRRTSVNLSFNFGRTPLANCQPVIMTSTVELKPWPTHRILGREAETFTFTIGPSGGERGYAAITGRQPWGIAFYVNGILIPELVLKRGQTYNFIVETGDDVDNPAEYHPIYLSTDPGGGYAQKNATERAKINVIYGIENGEPVKSATGTLCEWKASSERGPDLYDTFEAYKSASLQQACTQPKRSGLFKFAPTNDTPNTIYYQCYQHRFLGWKIRVVNDWDEVDGGAGVAFQMSAALTLCIAAVTLSLVSSSSS